ncbi:RRM domain-containing protein [Pleurotus pulmonarius]
MSDTITKRLHISGLTPAITKDDLQKRLSSFGTVKSLDGFGLLDGVGRPRKFGYITLETTAPQLSKCLNILSGSTWKGTKLRIGDAKPDYEERLAKERDEQEPPRKKRRCIGIHAEDMSIVTPENVSERRGWKVTPLGRIVRPMRMRPGKPLAEPAQSSTSTAKTNPKERKKKNRVKPPPTRARRRTIDPTAWGSTHLKGIFLDAIGNGTRAHVTAENMGKWEESAYDSSEESEREDEGIAKMDDIISDSPPTEVPMVAGADSISPSKPPPQPTPNADQDLIVEKTNTLRLLDSLFGGKDDDNWVGQESLSDIDEAETNTRLPASQYDVEPIEEVPMEVDEPAQPPSLPDDTPSKPAAKPTAEQKEATNLKSLFASREEDAGFSLFGNLGVDLELDDDFQYPLEVQPVPAAEPEYFRPVVQSTASATRQTTVLDPKKPLFFPLSTSFKYQGDLSKSHSIRGKAKDIFDVATERGWNWRESNSGFWRTETDEQIKKRWEDQKVELTRDWRRRWREAGKLRRRRGADGATE